MHSSLGNKRETPSQKTKKEKKLQIGQWTRFGGQKFSGLDDSQKSKLGSSIRFQAPASSQIPFLAMRRSPAKNKANSSFKAVEQNKDSVSHTGHSIRASPAERALACGHGSGDLSWGRTGLARVGK